MLKFLSRTAWITLIALVWAVLFSKPVQSAPQPLSSLESGLTDLVYELSRSIVTVEGSRRIVTPPVDGVPGEALENLISTGLVCDSLGHILVAASSVYGQDRITVATGEYRLPADLVGIDYFSDLALLRVKGAIGKPARLSDRQVCAGQMVVALGNSYGMASSPSIGFCAGVRPDGTLQFSVPVTSSSVGGGIFDLSGKLLGIIVGALGQSSRVALAVPAYQLPSITSYLLQHGDRPAGYIGVSTADIEIVPPIEITSPFMFAGDIARAPLTIGQGVVVTYVAPSSPAASAGIEKGDLLVGFDNQRLTSAATLASFVRRSIPGTHLEVAMVRHNATQTAHLTVGRKQFEPNSSFSDIEQFDDMRPSADSLSRLLEYLKQEVTRLESRLQRLR